MCDDLIHVCKRLYAGEIGDDVSVATVMVRADIDFMIGLPKDKSKDREMLEQFIQRRQAGGCGRFNQQMVAREAGRGRLIGSMDNILPPLHRRHNLVVEGT